MGSGNHRSDPAGLRHRIREAIRSAIRPLSDADTGFIAQPGTENLTALGRTEIPHPQTDECWPVHCAWHHVDEPASPDDYRTCFECFHVFRTAGELLAAHNKLMSEIPSPSWAPGTIIEIDAGNIHVCPLCAHDF